MKLGMVKVREGFGKVWHDIGRGRERMNMLKRNNSPKAWGLGLICLSLMVCAAAADDQPQWGQKHTRNMVYEETNLPESFDVKSGKNVKWTVKLGRQNYATPIVSGGKILIGANNELERDPRHKGDRGVLLCLNETDGTLCWQLVVPKLEDDEYLDWPLVGMVSPPTVEGDWVYVLTNRAEVLCLDLKGLADGNDGPYQDEGRHMTPRGEELMKPGKLDADIIWLFDMRKEVGMYPHDEVFSSILLDGDVLYLNTCNGVDGSHVKNPAPNAPSLIALNKKTGRLLSRDNELIGGMVFHATWSSPAMGEIGGRDLVFFGGGDGVCYAFEALQSGAPAGFLKRVWRFDCDPTAPKENIHDYQNNPKVSPSNIKGMPVYHKNRVYVTAGGDIWWGKRKSWLKCIDATKSGNITESGQVWSYELNSHSCSTPAIYDGMVFITDCGRTVHCLDAETGKPYWTHETGGEIWASPVVADGKVYVGTRRKDFWIFEASRKKKVLCNTELDAPVHGAVTPANGVLYIPTMETLYAIEKKGK